MGSAISLRSYGSATNQGAQLPGSRDGVEGHGNGKRDGEEGKGKGKDLETMGEGDAGVYAEGETRRSLSSEVDVELGVERQEGIVVSNTLVAGEGKV